MKTRAIILNLAVVFLLSPFFAVGPSSAAVIRIPVDQPNIQAGIDAADPGDTVLVADGTWTGQGNRDLDFGGKAITLISENGPTACVIDCQGSDADRHRGIWFHSGEGRDSVVEGFGIIGGYKLNGGAILCDGASPTIMGNSIEDNFAVENGGGVYILNASPAIGGNLFIDNHGENGGAIGCEGSGAPQISSNQVYANTATSGGGIWCHGPAAQINNNLIFYNVAADDGGAIHCSAPAVISFCTIDHNIADSNGGGVYGSGTVDHTIFTSNLWESVHGEFDVTWSCIHNAPGQGNFSADPLFVTGPGGDYCLSQTAAGQAEDSPCVDAGNPAALLIDGTTRTDESGDRVVVDVGFHYPEPGTGWKTLAAGMTCAPISGTLPFNTLITVTIGSNYKNQARTAAGRIDLFLAGGQQYDNWRAGHLNLQPEEIWSTAWGQSIPALAALIGETVFALRVEDITPSPYNQPPYPPSGDIDSAICTITGIHP